MAEFEPLHTQIQKITPTMVGTVILEDPHGFPPDETNLYCLDKNGKMVWRAQKPEPAGLYSRVMLDTDGNGNTLSAYAVTGQACELDLISGNLISQAKIK